MYVFIKETFSKHQFFMENSEMGKSNFRKVSFLGL